MNDRVMMRLSWKKLLLFAATFFVGYVVVWIIAVKRIMATPDVYAARCA